MHEKFKEALKEYDKFLIMEHKLDGSKVIYRQSPFSKMKYKAFTVENRFIGSGYWIIKKLNCMDTQKHSIFQEVLDTNRKIIKHDPETRRMSEDVASLILEEYI